MSITRSLIAGSLLALAAAAPASAGYVISVENPGVTNTTAAGTFAVETFNTANQGFVQTFSETISGVTFSYAGVDVRPADIYGGVGGSQYAATYRGLNFNPYDQSQQTYTLDVSTTGGPLNFFGAYFSAQDLNNEISFYKNGNLILTFTPAVVLAAIANTPAYVDGNNLTNFYANIYFTGGATSSFDSIKFDAAGNGTGFETDNHTIGTYVPPITGNIVADVPEPATWALMIIGFGLVGVTARRRKAAIAA